MKDDDASAPDRRVKTLAGCRAVEQMSTCKRYGDPRLRAGARRAFREKWEGFMEGGWESLLAEDPAAAEAARRRLAAFLPTHPASVSVAELLARVVDLEKVVDDRVALAALLLMERHGHVDLRAGWACRPAPRVPRRGHAFEDLFLLLGFETAREPPDDGG